MKHKLGAVPLWTVSSLHRTRNITSTDLYLKYVRPMCAGFICQNNFSLHTLKQTYVYAEFDSQLLQNLEIRSCENDS